jgi:hypothetical protein
LAFCPATAHSLKHSNANTRIHRERGDGIVASGRDEGQAGEMEDHIRGCSIDRAPHNVNVFTTGKVAHVPHHSAETVRRRSIALVHRGTVHRPAVGEKRAA